MSSPSNDRRGTGWTFSGNSTSSAQSRPNIAAAWCPNSLGISVTWISGDGRPIRVAKPGEINSEPFA